MADKPGKHNRYNNPLLHYAAKNSLRTNPVLEKLQEYTRSNVDRNIMLSNSEELQLLANLARSIGAKKTLDVGVYTRTSALAIAQVLPEDGKVVACDVSEEFTAIAKPFWKEAGVDMKIDLRIAPACGTLEGLLAAGEVGTYDFAFIDADQSSFGNYYELCLKLIRQNGIIVIDNTLWDGKVMDDSVTDEDTSALRALNEKICTDDRVSANQLFIGDGTTLVFKL